LDPRVVEGLLCRRPILGIISEESRYIFFSLITHRVPIAVVKREFPDPNRVHDLLVRRSIKWRVTTQKYIEDDSAASDIAFFVIISSQNFRGDVIRLKKLKSDFQAALSLTVPNFSLILVPFWYFILTPKSITLI
jgi:hypothetical protein